MYKGILALSLITILLFCVSALAADKVVVIPLLAGSVLGLGKAAFLAISGKTPCKMQTSFAR